MKKGMPILDKDTRNEVLRAQKNEITEYHIYEKLSTSFDDEHNKKILDRISQDEIKHYHTWKEYTGRDTKPHRIKIWFYILLSHIFGVTFGIKLMEKGEEKAQNIYRRISSYIPVAESIAEEACARTSVYSSRVSIGDLN